MLTKVWDDEWQIIHRIIHKYVHIQFSCFNFIPRIFVTRAYINMKNNIRKFEDITYFNLNFKVLLISINYFGRKRVVNSWNRHFICILFWISTNKLQMKWSIWCHFVLKPSRVITFFIIIDDWCWESMKVKCK